MVVAVSKKPSAQLPKATWYCIPLGVLLVLAIKRLGQLTPAPSWMGENDPQGTTVVDTESNALKIKPSSASTVFVPSLGNCTEGTTALRRGVVSTSIVIPPIELRKGNRRKFTDEQYMASAARLVDSIRLLVGTATAEAIPTVQGTSLDGQVVMDYGCGPGRFLVGMQAAGICFDKYIGVDVGVKEIDWLQTTHAATIESSDSSKLEFIRVNVQNDRYNKNGVKLQTTTAAAKDEALIFTPEQTARLTGKVDLMVLRSVFSHMLSEDIFHHLKALRPILKPKTGIMAVSLFVRPDAEETVISQEKTEQGLHIVVISKQVFESMVHKAGYHILLYTTLMGQETYILATGSQKAPQTAE